MKRRFKFVSEAADGLGLALRVQEEGNDVLFWSRDKDSKSIGNGLVERAGDMEDLLVNADRDKDIFVFDVSGNGTIADALREQGHTVVGGSLVADRLERDRAFGNQVMADAGIKTPKTTSFNSFDDAIAFVGKHQDGRFVYKPSKHLGDLSPSHVSFDNEDLLELLENVKHEVSIADPQFELQEFVKGVAISTEMWFTSGGFIEELWNHTLERKELMDGNIGPSGGCTGNIVWRCGDCPLCELCRGLHKFLRSQNFVGPIDLNAILTEDGKIYGLEWTPRFGYDATPTLMYQLLDGDISEVLYDVASGGYWRESPRLRDGFASGLRVTVPPWPTEQHLADRDVPIRSLSPKDEKDFYLYNVKRTEGRLYTAGAWGIIGCITSSGASVGRAFKRPYEIAEALRLKDKQYRTDLVQQFKKDLDEVEAAVGLRQSVG